jgi:hypothetical protein
LIVNRIKNFVEISIMIIEIKTSRKSFIFNKQKILYKRERDGEVEVPSSAPGSGVCQVLDLLGKEPFFVELILKLRVALLRLFDAVLQVTDDELKLLGTAFQVQSVLGL